VGEDALATVARLAYPARVVEDETARLGEDRMDRGGLTAAVRRAVVDAQSQLGEALRSRALFG
jgi:aminopeptidase N